MSLTFYYAPHSSASPVHWTLEELGISYEKVPVDLKAGDNKKPEFLKLNPNGKVPLLVQNGLPIFESAAIQIYLGEQFGVERGLYPPPGIERAMAVMWIVWTNATLGEAMSRLGRNLGEWAPEDERNEKAGKRALEEIQEMMLILDKHLEGRSFLTGEQLTLADLHLASWIGYVQMMKIDLAPYRSLSSWVHRCQQRPSFQTAR